MSDPTYPHMPDPSSAEPPTSGPILQILLEAGNLDRLAAEARRFLARDPEDSTAHFYLVLALTDLRQPREAKIHLDHLLSVEPEEVSTHIAALCLYGSGEQWSKVRQHAAAGLRIDPENAFFHRYAAIAAMQKLDLATAREHISRSRELDPDDADTANLYLRIHAADETSTEDAVKRLEEYRAALRLDPNNAGLHNSIGDLLLNELADPVEAGRAYREALRLEPGNRIYQVDLFQAVAGSSFVYRLFSIPSRTFAWLGFFGQAIIRQPGRLIFLAIGFKVVLAYFGWLMLATLIFWPGGKAYEWLLVSEIKSGSAASTTELRLWFWMRRWPGWARFGLFLAINLALWGGLFAVVGIPLWQGYLFVAVFTAVHVVVVAVLWGIRRGKADHARRKLVQRRKTPPPLPS